MTEVQSMMLSVVFGSVVGWMIGGVICMIRFAIDDHKEKKRKKAEEAKALEAEQK